jgi:small-conductance mechanosensitive channel
MSFPEPRPVQITFPVDAARRALDRIDELLEVLEQLSGAHDEVTTLAPVTFGGTSRLHYERELGVRLTDLAHERSQLVQQHAQIAAALARAERLAEQRRRDLAAWQQRREAWNERYSDGSVTPR